MPVNIKQEDGVMIARLEGEIDHHTAGRIRETIDERMEKTKPRRVELDFSNVSFMDSSGIGLIMGRYKVIHTLGGTLHVVGVTGAMMKIMRLAGLEKLGVFDGEVKENEIGQ